MIDTRTPLVCPRCKASSAVHPQQTLKGAAVETSYECRACGFRWYDKLVTRRRKLPYVPPQ